MPFSALGLSPELVHAIGTLGLRTPTPIQAEAIPPALGGADLLATAQTGSGKTVAYALPLLQRLPPPVIEQRRRLPQALVLVPTRELAVQAGELLRDLARQMPGRPQVAVVFGGVSANPQMMALRGGCDVVVATPGRLLDLVDHNALSLSSLACLVLDEADRLLDLGFAEELQRVLGLLPERRQNLFFSATFPPAVEALARGLLRDPVRVEIATTDEGRPDIAQRAVLVDTGQRTALLRHLQKAHAWKRALVFVATRYTAEHVADKLYKKGVFATAFHGELSQGARQQILDEFKAGRWDLLLTTDLAARGIDIEDMGVVVNYDLPRSAVDYVHRIGRTGRAGASGVAVSFVSASTEAHFRLIEKRNGVAIEREIIAGFEPVETTPAPAPAEAPSGAGGIKGRRPSKKDKLRAAAAQAALASQRADEPPQEKS
ncbi:DEAD/DEAH box helicase [Xylophilus sp. GOD-11R]|uniref:DEAD/DEAH box helicase n=1 Tax=Xylophilus sp. GOD-11R TaxID=3089814 RepID=UPI00298BDC2C|nr:DEAD/DEAH box helicase [Xylophilus sp. GOD-11R]WPB58577.1 DEAD/DEAH box helicase [Xylophilus sp. GOD-11R]